MKSKYISNLDCTNESNKFYDDKRIEQDMIAFLQKEFSEAITKTKYTTQIRPGTPLITFQKSIKQAKPFSTIKELISLTKLTPNSFVYRLTYPKEDWRTKKLCFEFQFGEITATDNKEIWASDFENKFFIDTDNIDVYNKVIKDLQSMGCHFIIKGEKEDLYYEK